MTTNVAATIKYAIREGLTTVSLSTGRDGAKPRWSPTEVVYSGRPEVGKSVSCRLAYIAYLKAIHCRERKRAADAARRHAGLHP